jgi:hypothetical protein
MARSGPKTKVTASTRPLSESVAQVPICQTRRPSAKTLRYGADLASRKDIDLIGLGQVLPEQVPRTW